eukprot:2877120-Rhodomonas_salina.4
MPRDCSDLVTCARSVPGIACRTACSRSVRGIVYDTRRSRPIAPSEKAEKEKRRKEGPQSWPGPNWTEI